MTAGPGRTSSWTPCWSTTVWTSSGATTTSCGWGRPAAPAPWWPRCWPIPSITTTWRSSRRDTASPCAPCLCLPTRNTGTAMSTALRSSSPGRTPTSTARRISCSPPGCTRPSPSSCSSWRDRSCSATRSTTWPTGCCWTRSTMRTAASPSGTSPIPWRTPTSPPWIPRTPIPSRWRRRA